MAKHRRSPRRRARGHGLLGAALRGIVMAGLLVLVAFAAARLFSFAAGPAGTGPAASLSGATAPGSGHGSGGGSPAAGRPAVNRGRARTTPPPASTPSPASTALPRVSGRDVTAVGDSVMVAATPALDRALPGIAINAVVSRQFSAGLQVIAQLKSEGSLRQVVVVGLGTNGTVTPAQMSQLLAEIGPRRRLVLVNTYEARSWEREVNSMLSAAAADHPASVVLADWYDAIKDRTYLLWPDGIHPQPAGGVVYARLVKEAVRKVAALPG